MERRQDRTELGLRLKTPRGMKVMVTPSESDYPSSCVANYERPAPAVSEKDVLEIVKREWRSLPGNDPAIQQATRRQPIIADLVDFEIYRCPKTDRIRGSELTSLHLFDVKAKNLCFDGYVRLGSIKCYVERIQIQDLSIGGYGSDSDPDIAAYLQTRLASRDATSDIWLRVRRSSPRYQRFHLPFLWVAVLGKHVIDYMDDEPSSTVGLENFTEHFHRWLTQRFGSNNKFQSWFTAFKNTTDFRTAFNAHAEFFYNQALNLSTSKHLSSHPVWAHCMCDRLTAIPRQPNVVRYTLATPHVYQCFKYMYFASKLKQISPEKAVSQMQRKRKARLGFPEKCTTSHWSGRSQFGTNAIHVRVGDVVSTIPDSADKAKWRDSNDEWLAYVQGTETAPGGAQRLMLLWLYRPADTNICHAEYPVTNELFLSDNCNCKERAVFSTDITRKHSVTWSPRSLDTGNEYIVRQTYMTSDSAFVSLKNDHKTCPCRKPKPSTDWSAGDTVYISKTVHGQELLEPVVIHELDYKAKEVKVRTLLRLGRDCSVLARHINRNSIAPNELVLTGKVKMMALSRVQRSCHVRFIPHADVLKNRIPSPYNLGGAGDYCGGGSLDRGLEQGGAVEFNTAVDYDAAAIHTQRANCVDPQRMRLYCGSVDDHFKLLLSDDKNRLVARVGEVDLIAAGSPCPGFSSLQQNILSDQSLTYASHITTFCTAVDVYRPLYGILENVVNMASTRKGFEKQNILSQLVACLVAMGYQVNQYIMDSWTYGSCQRRSRIILTIAAPGLEPMVQRPHTHSRSYKDTAARSLGILPNGERFGDREHYATPFPHVSAQEATADLPDIGNGNVQGCIPYPDHRLSRPTSSKNRALLECIPRYPPGYGYTEAMQLGLVPPLLRMTKKETERAFRRIKADGLIPTITTDINMQDARNGASVHWSQHRPLSIQEAKRTQGYLDCEPIIGPLNERWKIIGNGVDRKVSFSLGLALRDALANSKFVPQISKGVDDDTEVIVDVEEETSEWSSEAKERFLQSSLSASRSSSTDSFSSVLGSHRDLDLSGFLDGIQEIEPQAVSPAVAPLQDSPEAGRLLTSDEALMSRLPQQVAENVSSLPALPSFMHPSQPGPPMKRQRNDAGDEPYAASQTNTRGVKRAKIEKTCRTTSPTRDLQESEVGLERSKIPLPLSDRSAHTRSSGLAQYAPRTWHKEIGAADNVIELS
ncbi:cytosine-specific methyltransferase [Stagonosporopsis vannaccii]|nr:cytosine-specific methyltransferase [Stagonosporopsis vannaccii]